MKKIIISALLLSTLGWYQAQENKTTEDKELETWYHQDFATSKLYGVNTQNAYRFLESKGLKANPVVVGVLDSGVQVDHPGLKANIWVNTKEIPGNGIDDDKNGYVDDIHGWNFQGGKNGDVDVDVMEVTRVVAKYKPIFEGGDSEKNKQNQAQQPEAFKEYMKAKAIYDEKAPEAQRNYLFYKELQENIPTMMALLAGRNLTEETLASLKPESLKEKQAAFILGQMINDPELKGKPAQEVEKKFSEDMAEGVKHFESQALKQYNLGYDPRSIVGDNYNDVNERFYGNNHYEGPDALHGTHVAGIVAGLPTDKNAQYGVAYKVAKIMTVRAVPDGDERDKDVANAIRYAVDNGARILNMSFGKPISPNKEKVWEAFQYAQSKGVLLVKAAGNENEDISEHIYYPTNFKSPADAQPFINNMIVVGASTNDNQHLRASFSNYNQKMVDVFAPGDKIYSTIPTNEYKYLQGTSMASPVVAGAAAVLLAYMPNLKPDQIIEALVKTVNKSTATADIPGNVNSTFNYISRSGGVIDVAKAAEYAYHHFYQAGNHKNTAPQKSKKKPVKR